MARLGYQTTTERIACISNSTSCRCVSYTLTQLESAVGHSTDFNPASNVKLPVNTGMTAVQGLHIFQCTPHSKQQRTPSAINTTQHTQFAIDTARLIHWP